MYFIVANDIYPKACYLMLKRMGEHGFNTWANDVRLILVKYGSQYVWERQEIDNTDLFLRTLEDKMYEQFQTTWYNDIMNTR